MIARLNFKNTILPALIIFALCLFSYFNSFHNDYVLDDYEFLVKEGSLKDIDSTAQLFTENFYGFYRPVAFSFLRFSLLVFQDYQVAYHVLNLILFFAVCLTFYVIIRLLSKNEQLALLSSCFFAVHPIFNVLVNFKIESIVSVYILCMQLSTICFLFYIDRQRRLLYWLSFGFYFLGLLSHEMCAILPVYFFLMMYFLKEISLGKKLGLVAPYAIFLTLYLLIRQNIDGVRRIDTLLQLNISWQNYVATIAELVSWYISKLIYPIHFVFLWDIPIASQQIPGKVILAVLVLTLCLYFVLIKWKKGINAFALTLFLTGFLPFLMAAFVYTAKTNTAFIETTWFIFPSIGFFILLSQGMLFLTKFVPKKIWLSTTVIFILVLSFLTQQSNAFWKNEESYCGYWTNLNPNNGAAWDCRARAFVRKNDKGLYQEKYKDCAEIADVAGAYNLMDESKKAIEYYLMALKTNENCTQAYYGLGVVYSNMEDYRRAELAFEATTKVNPQYRPAYEQLIELYEKQNDFESAQKIKELLKNK